MTDTLISNLMATLGEEVAAMLKAATGRDIDFSLVVHDIDRARFVSSGGQGAADDLRAAAEQMVVVEETRVLH